MGATSRRSQNQPKYNQSLDNDIAFQRKAHNHGDQWFCHFKQGFCNFDSLTNQRLMLSSCKPNDRSPYDDNNN